MMYVPFLTSMLHAGAKSGPPPQGWGAQGPTGIRRMAAVMAHVSLTMRPGTRKHKLHDSLRNACKKMQSAEHGIQVARPSNASTRV